MAPWVFCIVFCIWLAWPMVSKILASSSVVRGFQAFGAGYFSHVGNHLPRAAAPAACPGRKAETTSRLQGVVSRIQD